MINTRKSSRTMKTTARVNIGSFKTSGASRGGLRTLRANRGSLMIPTMMESKIATASRTYIWVKLSRSYIKMLGLDLQPGMPMQQPRLQRTRTTALLPLTTMVVTQTVLGKIQHLQQRPECQNCTLNSHWLSVISDRLDSAHHFSLVARCHGNSIETVQRNALGRWQSQLCTTHVLCNNCLIKLPGYHPTINLGHPFLLAKLRNPQ